MNEMVERVARAMWESMRLEYDQMVPWEEAQDNNDELGPARRQLRLMARAAIAAMREPTEEMFRAAEEVVDPDDRFSFSFAECWRAMIDAVLAE